MIIIYYNNKFKKQQALDADPGITQRIYFTGNLDRAENFFHF